MLTERERINEVISAWFEPMPVHKPMQYQITKSGAWYFNYVRKQWFRPKDWQPLDYYTDEAANARLLEAMPLATLARENLHAPTWCCWPLGLHLNPLIFNRDRDRKTAIVLAFCKFAGIEVAHEAS